MNIKEAYMKIENTLAFNNGSSNLEFNLSHNNLDCNNADEMRECLKVIKNALDFRKISQEYEKDPNVVISDIIDRKEEPKKEEFEDSFPKYAGPLTISRKDTNAWHMYGEPQKNGFMHLTCFKIPVQDALKVSHEHNSTLTVFISACMMMAILNLQKEKEPVNRWQRVKMLVPINLRTLFDSNTLRNFSMYTIPEIDPRLGEYTLQEICEVIKHKMGTEFTAKHMSRVIATNVKDEKNPLVRLIPLPIKNLVMKAIFNTIGEKKSCMDLSNMGKIKLPKVMDDFVERFDFILGVHATAPYNAGMLSYKDTIYINVIRNIIDPELERHFYAVLKDLGLPVTVESNKN